jgi:fructokinase
LTKTGVDLVAEKIAFAAAEGDVGALDCLRLYVDRLGRGLATVVNLIDPDVIVVGGGLSNIPFDYAFSDSVETLLVRAAHGDSSGVRGAAWLWPRT